MNWLLSVMSARRRLLLGRTARGALIAATLASSLVPSGIDGPAVCWLTRLFHHPDALAEEYS